MNKLIFKEIYVNNECKSNVLKLYYLSLSPPLHLYQALLYNATINNLR